MSTAPLGDMSQYFSSVRNTSVLKNRLADLSLEMSSGQVGDIASHLRGDTTDVFGMNREITVLEGYQSANDETGRMLEQMQLSLQSVESLRSQMSTRFLPLRAETGELQISDAARSGRDAFGDMVDRLNRISGDRALFSGTGVDRAPLASSETMLVDIVTALGGATDTATIISTVSAWFDATGGGFETVGYLGETQNQSRTIDQSQTVQVDARADDPALRQVMKGIAVSAVADAISGTISARTKAELVQNSGLQLADAAAGLSYLQGRLGQIEGLVGEVQTTISSQVSAFRIARSDLVKADPFETATRLQDVQSQLETHFAVTARLSRLTLADYLR